MVTTWPGACAPPHQEHLRLIGLTGHGREEDRSLARDVGFDAYLIKPGDIDELQSLLEQARPKSTK